MRLGDGEREATGRTAAGVGWGVDQLARGGHVDSTSLRISSWTFCFFSMLKWSRPGSNRSVRSTRMLEFTSSVAALRSRSSGTPRSHGSVSHTPFDSYRFTQRRTFDGTAGGVTG